MKETQQMYILQQSYTYNTLYSKAPSMTLPYRVTLTLEITMVGSRMYTCNNSHKLHTNLTIICNKNHGCYECLFY